VRRAHRCSATRIIDVALYSVDAGLLTTVRFSARSDVIESEVRGRSVFMRTSNLLSPGTAISGQSLPPRDSGAARRGSHCLWSRHRVNWIPYARRIIRGELWPAQTVPIRRPEHVALIQLTSSWKPRRRYMCQLSSGRQSADAVVHGSRYFRAIVSSRGLIHPFAGNHSRLFPANAGIHRRVNARRCGPGPGVRREDGRPRRRHAGRLAGKARAESGGRSCGNFSIVRLVRHCDFGDSTVLFEGSLAEWGSATRVPM